MKMYKLFIYYVISLISISLIIFIVKNLKNVIIISILLAIIPIIIYLILNKQGLRFFEEKTAIRYTMHCKNCGWEWMSNISEKAPSICPNCHLKDKSEVIGWRKVKITDHRKQEKDLRKFLKL